MEVKTDADYKSVHVGSDKKIVILNENHILKALGFANVSEDDINNMFSDELT
jgi:hypothetical protein